MFRLLNLLLREWKMCQLEAKIEAKKYPKFLRPRPRITLINFLQTCENQPKSEEMLFVKIKL